MVPVSTPFTSDTVPKATALTSDTKRGPHRGERPDAQVTGDSERLGHPAGDRAARLRCRQAVAGPVDADDAKTRLAGHAPQVRRLEPAARPAVAPPHRPGIRDAIGRESPRAAAGEPDRLVLHALLLTIRGQRSPRYARP